MRKCFDKTDRIGDHAAKLDEFARKNPGLKLTHRDFLDLFNNEMTVCTLSDSFKRKMVGWKLFTILQDTPGYNGDEVVVENGVVKTKTGFLEKPVSRCEICRRCGLH